MPKLFESILLKHNKLKKPLMEAKEFIIVFYVYLSKLAAYFAFKMGPHSFHQFVLGLAVRLVSALESL